MPTSPVARAVLAGEGAVVEVAVGNGFWAALSVDEATVLQRELTAVLRQVELSEREVFRGGAR